MSNRQIGTLVLVIAMMIVAISVLFTNNLARALQIEEQKNMAIWAEATQQLINAGENEEVAEFIEKEMGMCPDPLTPYLPERIPGIRGNQLQLLPHVHGTDGFFLARFVKKRPDDQEET